MSHSYLDLAVAGVRGLKPYQPGKPISELEREYGVADIIKLASNENPLGPAPSVLDAIARAAADITRYPDANAFELKQTISSMHGVSPDCVTLGNGSNDVLVLLAEAFLQPGLEAVYSEYAFAVYPIAVRATGATARVAPALAWDAPQPLGHDLAAMADRVGEQTRLAFIANPNNPTGTWVGDAALESFIASMPADTLVVVDEAYADYVEDPSYPDCTRWLDRYSNLVVTRTFSKAYGLAGLRLGYGLSNPEVADILNRVRQPFNVSALAQAAGLAALADREYLSRSVQTNNRERQKLAEALDRFGLRFIPSVGNFLLVDFGAPALPVYEALLRLSVIVRPVGNYGLPDCLRISIGTPEENDRLIAALGQVLEARHG